MKERVKRCSLRIGVRLRLEEVLRSGETLHRRTCGYIELW